jgi:signal transduction histidine kinase
LDKVLPRLDRVDRDHLKGIIKDLAQERDFLEHVFNLLLEGIVVADREGKIRFANRAAETILAGGRSLVPGEDLREAVQDLNVRASVEEALRGRVGVLDLEIALRVPATDRVTMTMVPIDDGSGGYGGSVFMVRNITAETLKQARYAWNKRMQFLSIMAAGIAHEVGNPLNSLDIHLQLIERKLLKGTRKAELIELLAVAKEEIRRLEGIVSQFLGAARQDTPEMGEGDIVAVLDKTLNFMDPEMQRHSVRLDRRYAPFVPPVVLNADQIRQVFINLIRNAIQSMPAGGTLRVEVGYARRHVLVSFADSGGGIPEDQLERIFEPYFTTRREGAGLGLTIVQKIVSEHGGDVLVSSSTGKGTTITVRIPVPDKYARLLPPTEPREAPRRAA